MKALITALAAVSLLIEARNRGRLVGFPTKIQEGWIVIDSPVK